MTPEIFHDKLRLSGYCSVGFLLLSALTAIPTAWTILWAAQTPGRISLVEVQKNARGHDLYRATVEYVVSGKSHTVRSQRFTAPSPGRTGDAVTVYYDTDEPQNATIYEENYTWALPGGLLTLGLFFGFGYLLVRFAWAYAFPGILDNNG